MQVVTAAVATLHGSAGLLAFAFFQLLLNLTLRLIACCALRKALSSVLKLLRGS